jgi:RimJ/RimL family protein N-acetyltransferase
VNIPLESDRLTFRQIRDTDLDVLVAHHSDPVTRSVYGDMTRADVWRRMAMGLGHWQMRGFGPYALEDKQSGQLAGLVSLWFPEGWQDIEIGYGIIPEFRRKGYAAEAVRRMREHGYKDRKIKKLVSYIQPSNIGSQAVAKSVGATPDGEFDMAGKPHIIFVHPKPETFN